MILSLRRQRQGEGKNFDQIVLTDTDSSISLLESVLQVLGVPVEHLDLLDYLGGGEIFGRWQERDDRGTPFDG